MNASWTLRAAREDDLAQVIALERAIAEAPHWTEAAYRGYVMPGQVFQHKAIFVAISSGGVQGFAAASSVANEAELETIAVAKSIRRSGLGSLLLHMAESWAKQHGASSVMLEVRSANQEARAFYISRGYVEEGTRPKYYKDPVDAAVLMRKNLDGQDAPG